MIDDRETFSEQKVQEISKTISDAVVKEMISSYKIISDNKCHSTCIHNKKK